MSDTLHGTMLVTGGAGFIGSHLVEALVARGCVVRVVDNFLTGRQQNLAAVVDQIELLEGDLSDPETAREVCRGVAVIFHVAALPSVPVSMKQPLETHRHGATATINLLAAARAAGVRRVVYSSSSSVYGGQGPFPQTEENPARPCSPYAAAKRCGELYVRTFFHAFGLDGVSLRYFNVFGPRQPAGSTYAAVFPAFITRMLRGERPVIYGDGHQSRDFTYVEDVVSANVLAAARAEPLEGQEINVAAGRQTNLLELVALINKAMGTGTGTDLTPIHEGERPGDVRRSGADITLAREQLGYEPRVSLEDGLRQTIDYFRGRSYE